MAKFSKFEEIQAWQKAYDITLQIYKITADSNFAKDFGLRDQIRRASVSIMANIAEGHGRRTNVEFANFLNIARLGFRSSIASVCRARIKLYRPKAIRRTLSKANRNIPNDIIFSPIFTNDR
jgi:hypothetical protein